MEKVYQAEELYMMLLDRQVSLFAWLDPTDEANLRLEKIIAKARDRYNRRLDAVQSAGEYVVG